MPINVPDQPALEETSKADKRKHKTVRDSSKAYRGLKTSNTRQAINDQPAENNFANLVKQVAGQPAKVADSNTNSMADTAKVDSTNSRSIKATALPKTGQKDENELLLIVLGLTLLGLGTTGLSTRKRK